MKKQFCPTVDRLLGTWSQNEDLGHLYYIYISERTVLVTFTIYIYGRNILGTWSQIERPWSPILYEYMEGLNLFYFKQFGFRKKHSTNDALAELTEKIRSSKSETISFFLDLKKAFDTLDHEIFLSKLEQYGIRHNCWKWFQSYLCGRSQRITLSGVSSNCLSITCGVPQGSILGPFLFLIYINDLPKACNHVSMYLFAGDTNLCGLECSRSDIQTELDNVARCLIANKLKLNLSKTFQISTKASASSLIFNIASSLINIDHECKYLGLIIDSKLYYHAHISFVTERLGRQCRVISKLRHFFPRYQLIEYYRNVVCRIIQYGVLVYGCCSFSSLSPIHQLQKKIIKVIYFRKRHDDSEDLFTANKILTVFELHIYELLKFVLKSLNHMHSEDYLNTIFQFESCTHSTTRADFMLLKVPLCQTKIKQNLISHRDSKLINMLKIQFLKPDYVGNATIKQVSDIYHNLKDSYIQGNYDLIRNVFFG